MKAGITAGFGSPLGADVLNQMVNLDIEFVRQGVPNEGDIAPLVAEFVGMPIRPLFLLTETGRAFPLLNIALPQLGADGFDLQIFNEPGVFFHGTLEEYVSGILAVHVQARAAGHAGRIIAGGIANLSGQNLDWLRAAVPRFPSDVVVDFHRYSYGTQSQDRPWPGFQSRQNEIARIRDIAAGREIACTEFGYHTAKEHKGFGVFGSDTRLSEEQVREYLLLDLRLFAMEGIALAAVYQWGDGPDDVWIQRFGVTALDGRFKPAVQVFRDWRI